MDTNHCPTCGRMISAGQAACDFCRTPADASGETCPNCEATLPIGAIFCVNCGFSLECGRLVRTVVEQPESATRRQRAKPYYGPGLYGLIGRAIGALLDDSGSSPSVRVRGLRHMALGLLVLVAWIAIIGALGYLVFEVLRPALVPARAARHVPDNPPLGFGWILFLSIFPAVWSILKTLIGLFQVVTGVSFADFHEWYENLPIWAILLLTPILVVVVVPLVIGLLVGSLAACGFLNRLATR
jgi:hypothetical protein